MRSIYLPILAFALYAGGCDSAVVVTPIVTKDSTTVTTLDVTRPCLQTYEFGNYGCSRTVVVLAPPSDPLPSLYRLDVRARWANSPMTTAALASPSDQNPALNPVLVDIILWDRRFVPAGDTASLWVIARVLDDVRPIIV